jgi:1,4-alpha-glucan branching enzyme
MANRSPDNWSHGSHQMKKNEFGVFEIILPAQDGQPAIAHNSKLKVGPGTWHHDGLV